MGFSGILCLVVVALLAGVIWLVVSSIREKQWMKSILSIVIFISIVFVMYMAFISFITSM